MAPLVKVSDPEVQERQGTKAIGFGHTVAPSEAMWPPMDMPCETRGPYPLASHQLNRMADSQMRQAPIRNKSETLCNELLNCSLGFLKWIGEKSTMIQVHSKYVEQIVRST